MSRHGDGHVPEPDIDEIRDRLERTRHLRLALDLLEETLPGPYASDGLLAARAAEAVRVLDDLGLVIRLT